MHASLLLRSEANFFFVSVGTLQATAVVQEQDGEELRTLHLEEVVQEAAGEWQTLTNVFWSMEEGSAHPWSYICKD